MAGGLTLCHAMKSITPNLAVGGEGFYHLHKPLKGASLAARAMLGLGLGLGQVNPNPNPNLDPDPNPSQARAVWGPKEEHVATVKAGSF